MGKCMYLRKGETHTAPISGTLASDLAVGSTVKLMENGTAAEYLVVHQGLPSSMYDASCDGCWLLRKNAYKDYKQFHTSNTNDYENSYICDFLNNTFFNTLGETEQSVIKQVKIPYRAGSGTSSTVSFGANGLSVKSFLLGGYEVGFTTSNSSKFPIDGAKLSYFNSNESRIAYLVNENGTTAVYWWLRSAWIGNSGNAWGVDVYGDYSYASCSTQRAVFPALIVPSTALFDKNTLILKGVA